LTKLIEHLDYAVFLVTKNLYLLLKLAGAATDRHLWTAFRAFGLAWGQIADWTADLSSGTCQPQTSQAGRQRAGIVWLGQGSFYLQKIEAALKRRIFLILAIENFGAFELASGPASQLLYRSGRPRPVPSKLLNCERPIYAAF
jgi:hypothetical protein